MEFDIDAPTFLVPPEDEIVPDTPEVSESSQDEPKIEPTSTCRELNYE